MGIYAIVESGHVTDTVIWDGESNWSPIKGEAVPIDDTIGIGWLYDGKKFTAPKPPERTSEEKVKDAEQQKSSLISQAKSEILIWQTKLLMGRKLTPDEDASLNAWMDYFDILSAIETSNPDNINWPDQP